MVNNTGFVTFHSCKNYTRICKYNSEIDSDMNIYVNNGKDRGWIPNNNLIFNCWYINLAQFFDGTILSCLNVIFNTLSQAFFS